MEELIIKTGRVNSQWIASGIRRMIRTGIRKNFILRILFILFILGMTGCSSSEAAVPENLAAALFPKEELIDWSQDSYYVYALIHSEGLQEYGDTLLILEEENGSLNRVYENDFRDLQPWKIDIADIDGDFETEILVAVRKTTPYDKELKNRMFIFNYRDDVLVKKWTGSQIAGTWRDFYTEELVDASGEELIFLEQTGEGLERIKVYYWFDFGFLLLGESDEYSLIKELIVTGENSIKVTLKKGTQINLSMKNGKLVETE